MTYVNWPLLTVWALSPESAARLAFVMVFELIIAVCIQTVGQSSAWNALAQMFT